MTDAINNGPAPSASGGEGEAVAWRYEKAVTWSDGTLSQSMNVMFSERRPPDSVAIGNVTPLYAQPVRMPSREEVARAIACDLMRQDYDEESDPFTAGLEGEMTWSYIDQGEVDFGQIADRILALFHPGDTPDGGA